MNPPSLRDPTSHESYAPWYSTTSYYFRGNRPPRASSSLSSSVEERAGGRIRRNNWRMKPLNHNAKRQRTGALHDASAWSRAPWTARQRLGRRHSSGAFPRFDRSEVHGEESLLSPAGFMGEGEEHARKQCSGNTLPCSLTPASRPLHFADDVKFEASVRYSFARRTPQ